MDIPFHGHDLDLNMGSKEAQRGSDLPHPDADRIRIFQEFIHILERSHQLGCEMC